MKITEENFKLCLKNAAIYVILATIYVFVYLKYINPSYLEDRVKSRVEFAISTLPDNEADYVGGNRGKTREQIVKEMEGTFAVLGSKSLITSLVFFVLFYNVGFL